VATAVADRRLAWALDRILDDPGLGAARDRTCVSVRNPAGRPAYARNPAMPLIPASTTKVLTAAAALARLGPEFRFTTEVRAPAPPADGTVMGDLWFVGAGDPLLATGDFAAVAGYHRTPRLASPLEVLADRITAAGVRRVAGRVVGDESRYDGQRYLPTWSPGYITQGAIGPQSALTVNGGFTQWEPREVAAPAPATHAAAVLTSLLRARGVMVGGEAGEGKAPAGTTVVASIESPPLSEVIAVLLQESDNLTAELLVKELGARFGGAGTTAAGLEVVRSTLASLGLGTDGLAWADGSGLDRSSRLSCDALQTVLARDGEQGVVSRGLPLAGRNGTLARRFTAGPAAGRVRAKTGSLQGVTGLAGWATTNDGRAVQFALLANDLPGDGAGFGLQDRVANVLGSYPQAPPPGELAPRPPTAAPA
ncbi:MAG TPA: D-alanyl-D-alanine carboxypeptidase/D-alanyl-D-alanine-endopeptidase, partial [Acidimicrobiales bacterium]|nr:D-alanyl-D-alanine carboxypeptidase/D-alanyl-D-alanine-endopeptidase [Acidimicrobiales bacterium]